MPAARFTRGLRAAGRAGAAELERPASYP